MLRVVVFVLSQGQEPMLSENRTLCFRLDGHPDLHHGILNSSCRLNSYKGKTYILILHSELVISEKN